MQSVSIFNDVMGPVMRGPSSSHTAASYHLGRLIRDLLEGEPEKVVISFAKNGSYAEVYHQQGSDLGFASGIIGIPITSDDFSRALELAEDAGLTLQFRIKEFDKPVHPNTIQIKGFSKKDCRIEAIAKSIGGGAVTICELNGWPVDISGNSYDIIVELEEFASDTVNHLLNQNNNLLEIREEIRDSKKLLTQKRSQPLNTTIAKKLRATAGVDGVYLTTPFSYPVVGKPLFSNFQDMLSYSRKNNQSLGRVALAYESELLGISHRDALKEMYRRYLIMRSGVETGLRLKSGMQLLTPTAGKIWESEKKGELAIGGLHTKAAVRALAVMHVNSSMGVVCASPTGGASGTLPGVIITLVEEKKLNEEETSLSMFAAAAIGLILAIKGTFAAEVAGCQVEIGAAGAMGAAAVIEAAGGSAEQACDAASISFQNTMGSVCDLVQGIVEIPCHTRNAVAASSAFVCADLILGGYFNPIPLDETIDAVMSVGRMLPRELRCTVLGGLALAPSATALKNLKYKKA